jgi:hypothetical protein
MLPFHNTNGDYAHANSARSDVSPVGGDEGAYEERRRWQTASPSQRPWDAAVCKSSSAGVIALPKKERAAGVCLSLNTVDGYDLGRKVFNVYTGCKQETAANPVGRSVVRFQ